MVLNASHLIAQKRDGKTLDATAIADFIRGYTDGSIPDYQMAALAMAICVRGMQPEETAALTEAMLLSGTTLTWSDGTGPKVDKHSTGGIGDKVSLILAPLLACCDLHVPMLSGRGLGATGGTLDKLESIAGFRTNLSREEIQRVTESVGCVITGTTEDLAPADRKLYALRDVTATVPSIPLITASILSKKLAESLDALVLDVKCGSGAFMKTPEAANQLAESLVAVGQPMGLKTRALVTDMNQPLGRMVGNAVEVDEALDVLGGEGPNDLRAVTLALGAELLVATDRAATPKEAASALASCLASGHARERFEAMVAAQGGDLSAPRPTAPSTTIEARERGFVTAIDGQRLGEALVRLGGGRQVITDRIDPSVGLEMHVRLGDPVDRGERLMTLFAPSGPTAVAVSRDLVTAVTISDPRSTPPQLIANRPQEP